MAHPMPAAFSPIQQLMARLDEHVTARLRALPPGWRVMVRLDGVDNTVGAMTANWSVKPLGPNEALLHGWMASGPLPLA